MVNIIKNLATVNRNVGGNLKKYIVIHYTGNQTDTAKGNSNYFKSVYRGSSAHYFVDKDSIYQVVEDNDIAFAVGKNYGKNNLFGTVTNKNSISVEMCSDNGAIAEGTILMKRDMPSMTVGSRLMATGITLNQAVRWPPVGGKLMEHGTTSIQMHPPDIRSVVC